MKKKIIGILVVTLLIGTIIPVGINATDFYNPLDGGWLEERNGVKILHLNGSYYNVGYQHGYLLKGEIRESMRAQLAYFEDYGYPYERLVEVWGIMDDYLPNEYKEEMQGMSDGGEMSFEEVAVLTMMSAVFNHIFEDGCCGIALWGDATLDGKLYHVRSWDCILNLSDPKTGTSLQENIVLIVRTPEIGYASIIPDFAGAISSWNGINEKGIVITENTCVTKDTSFHGICPCFRMRMVLDSAATSEEAITILTSNRTCGTNFVLSDANVPIGYALDQTANISYVGKWDDPIEGTSPFWQIKDVVRRVPQYVHPECAAVELNRLRYNPGGLLGFLWALQQKSFMFVGWTHYRALSEEIENRYGSLDLNGTMSMLRDEYVGNTDFFLKLARELGFLICLYQWVCCPEIGDILISFASNDTLACYNSVYYFNMFELFEAESP